MYLICNLGISQALVLGQLIPMVDYGGIYRLISMNPLALNTAYFPFIWEIPILEYLVSVISKTKDNQKLNFLLSILQKPEINQHNPPAVRAKVVSRLVSGFFKELLREFIGNHA